MRLKIFCFIVFACLCSGVVTARDMRHGCSFSAQWPMGMSEHRLISQGHERRYLAYLPRVYATQPTLPIVMSFHGFASTPEQNVSWSHLEQIAEQYGFIAIFPAAAGNPPTWSGGSSLIANSAGGDDLVFISTLLDQVQQRLCVDEEQIYAIGFSAGAGMVARLACEMPERIAAVGTVSGAFSETFENCASDAMPIMMFHGDADLVVPYGGLWGFTAASSWAQTWADHNGCTLPPLALERHDDIQPLVFGECVDNADVVFYTVRGGGHTWPGGAQQTSALAGKTTTSVDAGREFWRFFRQYRRIERPVSVHRARQMHQSQRPASVTVMIEIVGRQIAR